MPDHQRPDYKTLIDEETWAFIARTDNFYPPETIDCSVDRQREIYDTMCRQFNSGYPDGVNASDASISYEQSHGQGHGQVVVPVRRYTSTLIESNAKVQIVYFHGGGFIVGGLDSHDDICAELCARTGFGVMSVDYRLSPEHQHPAAFNDSIACVLQESNRLQIPLLLCGDSAGGNLAAAVTHAMRLANTDSGLPAIGGQVLIYPGLGGDTTQGSYITHAEAPMLSTRDVLFYSDIRGSGIRGSGIRGSGIRGSDNLGSDNQRDTAVTACDATLAPLTDSDFSNLPNTIIVSAACDPLADDGRHYRDAIINAGGNAAWFNEGGLVHGYLRARHSVVRARDSFNRIVDGLKMLANGSWYS